MHRLTEHLGSLVPYRRGWACMTLAAALFADLVILPALLLCFFRPAAGTAASLDAEK